MTDGPTTSVESLYLEIGKLSGKMDAVITANAAVTTVAAIGRAMALKLEEHQTIEKADAAATEGSNRKFLVRMMAGGLTTIGLILGILYYLHAIYHWPT